MIASLALSMLLLMPADRPPDTAVVARVGRFVITAQELLDSYEFGPAFVRRSSDPLRTHLQYMIYERLLATEAEKQRLDTTLFVRERLSALEEDVAVDELYKEDILSTVSLTPEEVEHGVQKARMSLRLRWLYAESKREAEQLAALLKKGVPFDSLYRQQVSSAGDEASRSLETTILQLEIDRPKLAQQLARVGSQEISPPITGPDGFYVVRVDEIWQNPLMTEAGHTSLRERATALIRESKADQLAQQYVREIMLKANPVMKAEGFNIVRAFMAEKGLSRDTRVRWDIPATFWTEAGPIPIHESPKFLKRLLVTFGNQALTVRDYLRWYDIRQLQLKASSLAAFNSSVKGTIWKMLQDRLLSKEAYGRGYAQRRVVKEEVRKWEPKLLYLAARSYLRRGIEISDAEVRRMYEKEKNRLQRLFGPHAGFGEMKNELAARLYLEEEAHRVFRTTQRLMKEVPVHVDEQMVQRLARTLDRGADRIDVILYKPGGTFPRVAFPTIDPAWQSFH